jgi:hypothetical protein
MDGSEIEVGAIVLARKGVIPREEKVIGGY